MLLLGGCTRAHYRRQADRDAYALVDQKTCDPRWPLEDYSIEPDPHSRLFNPFSPDCMPMPPDDPTSNQLMQCVDGKRGWRHWTRNGELTNVEDCSWTQYLPWDAQGQVLLNRQGAAEIALLHSRDYQTALETLYLSALDVSYQRFRFDVQFFGSNDTNYTVDSRIHGPNPTTRTLDNEASLEANKLFATGAELVVGVANSLVWQFGGSEGTNVNTLASFNLLQPLLRAGGRAVVLESLTDSERGLVANVRQMEHYRRGFYVKVVAGRSLGTGPVRSGLSISSLDPGGGASASGYMGLLGSEIKIRNQRANMLAILESWRRLEALNQAGRVTRFQVDQTLQSLFSSQSALLSLIDSYENTLEAYKISLGLPPDLPVKIADPMVAQFDLIDPTLTAVRDAIAVLLGKVRDPQEAAPSDLDAQIAALLQDCGQQLVAVEQDVRALNEVLPLREQDLQRLSARPELQKGDVDRSAYSADSLKRRGQLVNEDLATLTPLVKEAMIGLAGWRRAPAQGQPPQEVETPRQRLNDRLSQLTSRLLQFSLVQARARLDSIRLVPVELNPREALQTACEHRLDWMNARAALVDVWRQVEVKANALEANLNFLVNGQLNNTSNNPTNFQSTRGQIQVGMQFDAPLTRLTERNAYREAQINYERARRSYMLFTDELYRGLRQTLRDMRTAQLDFELRRAAVFVAVSQVDLAGLSIEKPPKPGEDMQLSNTAARDILDSLTALLSAENNFLSAWLNYESQRLSLDFDLGTMQLDERGLWIDPGPMLPSETVAEPAVASP